MGSVIKYTMLVNLHTIGLVNNFILLALVTALIQITINLYGKVCLMCKFVRGMVVAYI